MPAAKYQKLMVCVYFSTDEQKARFEKLADKAGYNSFSKWIVQQLEDGTRRTTVDPQYLEQLEQEVKRLRKWFEAEREQNVELQRKIQELSEAMANYYITKEASRERKT